MKKLLFALLLVPLFASASTITLQEGLNGYTGTSDADINTYSPSANTGSATTLRLGAYGDLKSVFKFDVSSIPIGATINSATLSLYVQSSPNNGGGDAVSLHKVLTPWNESTVNWAVLGADSNISSTPESSPVVGYAPANVWVSFPITSLVSGWVNGTVPNNGVMLLPDNGPQLITVSSENSSASLRPKLDINYTAASAPVVTTPTPDTTAPSVPTGLTATPISTSAINLTWNASTDNVGVTGYKLYRGGTLLTTLGNVTSYQNTGLTASTAYTYTVQAFDALNNTSAQSTSVVGTTQAPVVVSTPAPTPINGTCGLTNGTTVSTIPTTNLCSTGTASSVTGATVGPWNWTCAGSNGGTTASCTAQKTVVATPAPTATLTASATSLAYNTATNISWSSTNATNCTLSSGQTGTSGAFSTGNLTTSTTYTLTCTGTGGTVTKSVAITVALAPVVVNGTCGSSNNTTVTTAPTTNLCSTGIASTISGTGPWSWTCTGTNGGVTASCFANKTITTTPTPTVAVGTYYVSPNGADSNTCSASQNINTPKKTLASAFSCLAPGSTLYLLDGTYTDAMANLPNGSATGGYITIAALNEGNVIITGGLSTAHTNAYLIFQGLRFQDSIGKAVLGNHLKFFRNEFKGGCPSGNCANTGIGTNDFNDTADILFEDNWWHGAGGRYNVIVYNANRVIIRRAVIRHDGGWTDTKGDPEATINFYNSSNSSVENSIIVDSDLAYHSWQGAYYSVYNSASPNATNNNTWYSNVAINTSSAGCGFRLDGNGPVNATVQDMYLYNTGVAGACLGSGSSVITASLDRMTVNKSSYGFVQYATSYTGTITNALLVSVSSPTDGLSINSTGSGAQLKGVGVSGTMYGESGWNSVTGNSFLPFPNETRIKKEMCIDAGVTRGFCSSTSLSNYVAGYMGSTISPTTTTTQPSTTLVTTTQTTTTTNTTPVTTTQTTTTPVTTTSTTQTTTTSYFTRDLTVGSTGEDVRSLQIFLNTQGFIIATSGAGSPGNETTTFGKATKRALAKFQTAYTISPASGYFGSVTRARVNSMLP